MREFAYERADTVEAAVAAFGDGARYLAGGTNLVDLMKLDVETPARLIDITRLGLDRIEPGHPLRIGAGVRNSDLAVHPAAPAVLRESLLAGASGQLRNVATVAGNLLQRTRCAYFQEVSKPCNKRDPGSGCPAIDGEHRNLAVLGHSPDCVATHPSDMAVALAALDANVVTDRRRIALSDFYLEGPERETVLEAGELITAVEIPPLPHGASSSHYRKVRDRQSYSFAVVSIAVVNGLQPRIAFGGLAHKPWRALKAEAALASGRTPQEAADAELADARPLRDNAFKLTIARNLLLEVLAT